MPVEIRQVEGIEGLLKETLSIAREVPKDSFLWFRGVHQNTYALIPKLMRDGKPIEDVFDRERRLITRFRQRSMAYWPAGYPQGDWEHLFAMQHFGMPTRLLDWSENLFVAAYFALGGGAENSREMHNPPAVWCFDPVEWNRGMPVLQEYGTSIQVLTTSDDELEAYRPFTNKRRNKSPLAIFGAHNSNRIVAQRGTFVIWGNVSQPLEEFAGETSTRLWKIEIFGERQDLSWSLRTLGFGETMVFPELPSLATELSRAEDWRD